MVKSILKYGPIVLFLAAPVAVGAAAGTSSETAPAVAVAAQTKPLNEMSADDLRGRPVFGADASEIGRIADVEEGADGAREAVIQTIDPTSGAVSTMRTPLSGLKMSADGVLVMEASS
ncbi:MAG: PRC-barrel domain-containing protein [Pseudomonadota bacterium]